jgi:ATP-dependent DNA ligase
VPIPGTTSTATPAPGWRPTRGDDGRLSADRSPGLSRSPGRTRRARAFLRSARRGLSATRKALDWANRFPTIAAAVQALATDQALLDGEIVSEDEQGIPRFSGLQADLKSGRRDRLRYHLFDLLYLDGFDLTGATLLDRKSLLVSTMTRLPASSPLRYSEHTQDDGVVMLKHACHMGLEGIVSKRKDLPYRSGRGEHWLKIKCVQAQERKRCCDRTFPNDR